jgi:hypothetical protein
MIDLAELTKGKRLHRPSDIERAVLGLSAYATWLALPTEPVALLPEREVRIQPRDLLWFQNTLRDGAWESRDFASVVSPAPNRARRAHADRTSRNHLDRLALLWKDGYFERVKYEKNRLLYVPTNKLERELHQRGWLRRTRRDYDNRNRRRVQRPESWKHTVRMKDFMQVLRRDVRALADVVLTEDGDAMQGGRGDLYAARRFKADGFDQATVSDKTLMLSFVTGRTRKKAKVRKHRLFAAEWHCGTEPLVRRTSLDSSFLSSKYERYHAYGLAGLHDEQFGSDNLTVLTIVEGGERHLANVCACANEVTGGRAPNRFLAARASELMAAPLQCRWLNAQGEPVFSLLS